MSSVAFLVGRHDPVVFVVLRRMGLVVADGSGERAMHIGLGILLVGLVATLLGAVMFR